MAPPSLTAQAVADLVGGRLLGDGRVRLSRVAPLEGAASDTLSFLASPSYLGAFRTSAAGAVLVSDRHAAEPQGPPTRIVVADPERALLRVIERLYPEEVPPPGIAPSATIGAGAEIGPEVSIGPGAVIGRRARVGAGSRIGPGAIVADDVTLGPGCVLGAHAVCEPGAYLGARVVLKAGAVVGGTGFGFTREGEAHARVPHVGRCVLEDDVEIGANTTVDRGRLEDTVIGAGTKLDNLVHVGHNVRMGRRCLVMATTGIAGSVRLGDDVIVAGGVGIADHLSIGARARLSAKSVVVGNIPADLTVGGYPARPHREFLRAQAALYRLPGLLRRLESLVEQPGSGGAAHD